MNQYVAIQLYQLELSTYFLDYIQIHTKGPRNPFGPCIESIYIYIYIYIAIWINSKQCNHFTITDSLFFSQFPVMIADGVDGSPIEYIFSYGIGSLNLLPTGSNPWCTSSSCQDVFRVTNSKVQQYLVSVAARNVVGLGTANTLVRVGMLCKKNLQGS